MAGSVVVIVMLYTLSTRSLPARQQSDVSTAFLLSAWRKMLDLGAPRDLDV